MSGGLLDFIGKGSFFFSENVTDLDVIFAEVAVMSRKCVILTNRYPENKVKHRDFFLGTVLFLNAVRTKCDRRHVKPNLRLEFKFRCGTSGANIIFSVLIGHSGVS